MCIHTHTHTHTHTKCWACSHVRLSVTPWTVATLLYPWNSPGKNIGVGCHFLLQGIFPTQGLNLSLPNCRQILYHLSHQGSPNIYTHTTKYD